MSDDIHGDCGGQHKWGNGFMDCARYDVTRAKCADAGRAQGKLMRSDNPSPSTVSKRKHFEKHPEKAKAKKKRYREKHPEKAKVCSQRYTDSGKAAQAQRARKERDPEGTKARSLADSLKKTCREHGIEPEDFWRMHEEQGGVCAICSGVNASGRRLAIDHCHETDRVRGLLCFNCNSAIGKFYDNPTNLRRAADYVERHCQTGLDIAS